MKKLFSHLYHSFTFFIIVLDKNPTKIEKTVDGYYSDLLTNFNNEAIF